MRVLGISAFYHDSAAVLVEDGRVVAAAQEERFTRIRHDAGFPRNPFALRRTIAIPAVGVGTLTALPLTPGPEDCSGTFRAGQEIAVSGGGFVPGTPVELYASSMGFGATPELLLATLTADANGDVSAVVRIPLAATGFRPEGAAAGIVFLDALGLGTAVVLGAACAAAEMSGRFSASMFGSEMGGKQAQLDGSLPTTLMGGLVAGAAAGLVGSLLYRAMTPRPRILPRKTPPAPSGLRNTGPGSGPEEVPVAHR